MKLYARLGVARNCARRRSERQGQPRGEPPQISLHGASCLPWFLRGRRLAKVGPAVLASFPVPSPGQLQVIYGVAPRLDTSEPPGPWCLSGAATDMPGGHAD